MITLGSAVVTSKNQISIPMDVVRKFNIQKGERLEFVGSDMGLVLVNKGVGIRKGFGFLAKHPLSKKSNEDILKLAAKNRIKRYFEENG